MTTNLLNELFLHKQPINKIHDPKYPSLFNNRGALAYKTTIHSQRITKHSNAQPSRDNSVRYTER